MNTVVESIDRWLFTAESPVHLGLVRIFLIGYLTTQLPELVADAEAAGALPRAFMEPGILLAVHPLPFPFPSEWIGGLQTVMTQLGILAAAGFLTRLTTFLFAFGYAYLVAVQSAWGWHDHGPSLVVQVLLVLAFLPGITSLSLDNLRRRLFDKKSSPSSWMGAALGSPVPRWGSLLVLMLVATFYFASGAAKLRSSGLAWMDGHTLAFYMSGNSLSSRLQQLGTLPELDRDETWRDGVGLTHYLYGARPSALARRMAQSRPLMVGLSVATIVLETLYPLILVGGVVRALFLLSGVAFHLSILFLMGISFMPWVIIDLCMVNWRALRGVVGWRRG